MSQAGIVSVAGDLPPSVPTVFQTDDNAQVVPLNNKLIVAGGTGTSTSGNVGTGTITITVNNLGFAFSEQSGSFNASVENGYYCNATLTVTLPPTAGLILGNTIIIYVDTTGTITVNVNSGQSIQFGTSTGTVSLSCGPNQKGSVIELNFKPSDLTWHTFDSIGSWVVN